MQRKPEGRPFSWPRCAWLRRGARPSRLSSPGSLRTPRQPDHAARPSSRRRALNLPDLAVRGIMTARAEDHGLGGGNGPHGRGSDEHPPGRDRAQRGNQDVQQGQLRVDRQALLTIGPDMTRAIVIVHAPSGAGIVVQRRAGSYHVKPYRQRLTLLGRQSGAQPWSARSREARSLRKPW